VKERAKPVSTLFSLLLTILALHTSSKQAPTTNVPGPLEQKVESFELRDQTIGEALGHLNQSFDISISIEGVLPEEGAVTNPKLTASMRNVTVAEVLDRLCVLDPRYTWERDGSRANFFPKTSLSDPNYFFNRTLTDLNFHDVRQVGDAVIAIDHQSGDPSGGVIYMGMGQTQGFAKAWTASFRNLTVRQALNRIAQQLGPTYGWQIGGTTKAKLIVFHYKLEAKHVNVGDQYPYKEHRPPE
jgi:hypothetical protein